MDDLLHERGRRHGSVRRTVAVHLDRTVDIDDRVRDVCGTFNLAQAHLVELVAEALETGA